MAEMKGKIQKIRAELGLKQGEFARQMGISQGMLSDIERGHKPLTNRNVKLICHEFGVSRDWLLTGQGEMFNLPPNQSFVSAVPASIDGRNLSADAIELLDIYDQLEAPEIRKYVRDYAREKLELQELRKQAPDEKGVKQISG